MKALPSIPPEGGQIGPAVGIHASRHDRISLGYGHLPISGLAHLVPDEHCIPDQGFPSMNIIGISAFFHESACCLLAQGELKAAAAEERFTRVKHDSRLPVEAFRFCLDQGGLGISQVDALAYYESPQLKLERQLWAGIPDGASTDLPWLDPGQAKRAIREHLGYEGPILTFQHHQSHAASSFFFSGFEEAAVLTVDGVGEWATTTYGHGKGCDLQILEEVVFPHSLGLLYSTLTSYLGFSVNDGEYKVMGLAPYGSLRLADKISQLVLTAPDGRFALDMSYFDFVRGRRMYTEKLCQLLGQPPRRPGSEITSFHQDVARGLQLLLEELLLQKVAHLHREVGGEHLCMAGGVALNCVANGRIRRESAFEEVFVQPAAGDDGACLGAAALAHVKLTGERPASAPLRQVFLGPSWESNQVLSLLNRTGLKFHDFRGRESSLVTEVARRLHNHEVVGWFQGAMEFGPRALGGRSILGNPLDPNIRQRLNELVKKREGFRPFAPSVLVSRAAQHFDLDRPSPFMLETCSVNSEFALPGITHVDGSARPQTVDRTQNHRFAALLEAFEALTGCPILVNTSFNVAGEPIVCSPADALLCFGEAGLDCLILEDFLLDQSDLPAGWQAEVIAWRRPAEGALNGAQATISETLYTFV